MADFSNSCSIHVNAEPAVVHALVNDFREWPKWSPWEGLDPDLRRTLTGPEAGVGSRYAWEGNSKAGSGVMEILRSDPSLVEISLEFLKPFKATNITRFALAPAAGGTDVTWTMAGKRGVLMGVMGKLYFDRAVDKDFEKGIAALKTAAESAAGPDA